MEIFRSKSRVCDESDYLNKDKYEPGRLSYLEL